MTDIAAPATNSRTTRPFAVSFILAVVSAAVVASLLCLAVAAIAHAAGASREFLALTPQVFSTFVVVGVLFGAIGWAIIRAKARNPRRLLGILAPVIVVVSLVPDILVGVNRALPGTTWTAVIALMVMHVVVAVCAVAAFRFFMPVLDTAAVTR